MSTIGTNIKKIRELKNLTQDYVAKKLGITRAWYIKLENNEVDLKFETLKQLAELFNVSIDDIIGFSDKNIFNTTHHNNNVKNVGNIINDFQHEEMKVLYEKLLQEKELRIKEKDVVIKQLQEIISKKLKWD